ncbi:hypothetical protein [Demequina sp.]|uniref:hypothetical protein n=1 Tax=Demequina sp. TaxID=2050685 RepID=UPI003D0E1503
MTDPRDAAAGLQEEQPGERSIVQQGHADTPSLGNPREEREDRWLAADRHAVAHALDQLLDRLGPVDDEPPHRMSDRWERAWANQMVAAGWDAEHLARRYGLTRKQVTV